VIIPVFMLSFHNYVLQHQLEPTLLALRLDAKQKKRLTIVNYQPTSL